MATDTGFTFEELTAPAEDDQGFSWEDINEELKPPTAQPPATPTAVRPPLLTRLSQWQGLQPKPGRVGIEEGIEAAGLQGPLSAIGVFEPPEQGLTLNAPGVPGYTPRLTVMRPGATMGSPPAIDIPREPTPEDLQFRPGIEPLPQSDFEKTQAEQARKYPKLYRSEQGAKGVAAGGLALMDTFLSPVGLGTLELGGIAPGMQRAVAAYFAAQMASETPELARQLGEEMGKPADQRDYERVSNLITQGVTALGFSAIGGLHAIRPGVRVPGVPEEIVQPDPTTRTSEYNGYQYEKRGVRWYPKGSDTPLPQGDSADSASSTDRHAARFIDEIERRSQSTPPGVRVPGVPEIRELPRIQAPIGKQPRPEIVPGEVAPPRPETPTAPEEPTEPTEPTVTNAFATAKEGNNLIGKTITVQRGLTPSSPQTPTDLKLERITE